MGSSVSGESGHVEVGFIGMLEKSCREVFSGSVNNNCHREGSSL